jgi:hypothetical protein
LGVVETGAEVLLVAAASAAAPGCVQFDVFSMLAVQFASPSVAGAPLLTPTLLPSPQAMFNRARLSGALTGPTPGTFVTVTSTTTDVTVTPAGIELTSNLSKPRRTPPPPLGPSRPASNQVAPPALLAGIPLLM